MLSCLSNSYSLGKYNKTGTFFTPWTFSYSTPKASTLTFTNNDDQAPVTISSTAGENAIYVSNFNPLKFNQDTFTIYIKHKFTINTSADLQYIMFFQANYYQGLNYVIGMLRNTNGTITCRCVKGGVNLHNVSFTPTTANAYLHFFLQVKPDPTTNTASTLQFNVYNTAGTRIFYNSTLIDISNIGNAFTDISAQLKMTGNVTSNSTANGIYDKAGWYNKELSHAERAAIVALSPT